MVTERMISEMTDIEDVQALEFNGEFEGVTYTIDYDGTIQFWGATSTEGKEMTEDEFLLHLEAHQMTVEALLNL